MIITMIIAGFSKESGRIVRVLSQAVFFKRSAVVVALSVIFAAHDPVMIGDSRVTMDQSTYLQSPDPP